MKRKIVRLTALSLACNLLFSIIFPSVSYALTGGPSQPEVQSFTPAGTSEMVDLFSGDFNYNIPLLDVGGYPMNLSYNSGIGMDQEASWTGLGWNINAGVINRSVRGVPDDFSGEAITRTFNMKPNETYGVSSSISFELFGANPKEGGSSGSSDDKGTSGSLSVGTGISYNNYNGYGVDLNARPSITSSDGGKNTLTAGLGLSASAESGVGVTPNISYSRRIEDEAAKQYKINTIGVGSSFNSRAGLRALSLSGGVSSRGDIVKVDDKKAYRDTKYDNNGSFSNNGGSAITFANTSYTPQISLPMVSVALNFTATLGSALFGAHANGHISGYFSTQFLAKNSSSLPAYGYLYAQNAKGYKSGMAMLDFNREKDGSFTKSTPNLPLTNFTYDVFSVAGQGVGGMYRPFRSDLGLVYDSYVGTIGTSADLPGLEFGGGNAVHMGMNFAIVNTYGYSGKWFSDNEAAEHLNFQGNEDDPAYEPAYFKQAGEKSAESDPSFFNNTGAFDPVRVEIGSAYKGDAKAKLIREKEDGSTQSILLSAETNKRKERQRRNQAIAFLNAEEASQQGVGLEPTIKSFPIGSGSFQLDENGRYTGAQEIARTAYPDHHISEMSVVRPDGARYFYGIPTYNSRQQETTFAVDGSGADCASGLVAYTARDDSQDNEQGLDNFYDQVETPEYATAYLLTAIVSPDYIDIEGDGPTDDDFGSYTKFNYSRLTADYHWRVPFEEGKASFNEGMKSDSWDDKASYLYGTKELWYLHSIETRTHVAEFSLSDRQDGYGVAGKEGGRGNISMQKLDKIELYSKADRKTNGSNATPVKVVHFVYDYTLCPGVPNNIQGGGKLTLKEVYFTYGNSKKGRLSPYRFHYESENPGYNLKGYDRWGNYKPNVAGAGSCNIYQVNTADYPYVAQNTGLADLWSSAWHLSSIDLPSGGKINVDFESDDYAYVQDRRAMQMFTVSGTGSSPADSPETDNQLEALMGPKTPDGGNETYDYLFFALQEKISSEVLPATADEIIQKEYIRDIFPSADSVFFQEDSTYYSGTLYFKFLMALDEGSSYEYVPGYAQIKDAGVATTVTDGFYTHGYVKLKKVGVRANDKKGADVHPISKAAWQFSLLYRPDIAYDNPRDPDLLKLPVVEVIKGLVKAVDQVRMFITGINQALRNKNYGKKFIKDKSFIRLYNPIQKKLGGGSRVAKVALSDEWGSLSNNTAEDSYEYGQVYDYTTTVKAADGSTRTISSGVAAYEPILGGEENPFRQPVAFEVDKLLAPSDRYYLEEPFGEMFFPGASVGYSKVTVKNLPRGEVNRNATGKVVHEFYTAKDFPVITRQTSLKAANYKPNPLLKLLKIDVKEYMTASQGYVVELNDMHGKPKGQWVYPENKTEAISGMVYKYKTDPANARHLDNRVNTVTKNLAADGRRVHQENVGVDFDVITDMREQNTLSVTGGLGGNLDAFLAALFPVTVPIVLPKFSQEEVRFRSAVTTKVIQRYGLIDEVEAYDLGAKIATKNQLYDAQTGEVLLTETQNQYEDPVFSFTYPAHWGYDGMGMAYHNLGLKMRDVDVGNIPNASAYFVAGDELMVSQGADVARAWVLKVNSSSLSIGKADGTAVEGSLDVLKVIRSGRRNQQATSIGSITSKQNPLQDTNNDDAADVLAFNSLQVLNAEAVEFFEDWKQFCNCGFNPEEQTNPYAWGKKGNWRAQKSYLYLTDRQYARQNDNPNVRHDGIYRMFEPFWNEAGNQGDWQADKERWTFTSQVTTYSPYGFELENKDALGRYSAAVYGYNHTLPTAVANNAQYKETAFDNFEDYDAGDCEEDHFSYRAFKDHVSEEESHSGRRSIKVGAGQSLSIQKVIIECEE